MTRNTFMFSPMQRCRRRGRPVLGLEFGSSMTSRRIQLRNSSFLGAVHEKGFKLVSESSLVIFGPAVVGPHFCLHWSGENPSGSCSSSKMLLPESCCWSMKL
ncbi:hypothetical protein XENORESO_016957 [Xenotaenia resolanae]|uniref:Uncharacterized protein n=1 Tax=Xenotaenia resolanae TaxID=208358 RepID=A0ABV0X337_9TELE